MSQKGMIHKYDFASSWHRRYKTARRSKYAVNLNHLFRGNEAFGQLNLITLQEINKSFSADSVFIGQLSPGFHGYFGRKPNCRFCNARQDVFRQDRHDPHDEQDFLKHVRLNPVNP